MLKMPLSVHGGGSLEIHGPTSARRWVIIMSRDTFSKDDPLVARIITHFERAGVTVARYEALITETRRLLAQESIRQVPRSFQGAHKALTLLMRPTHWRHFSRRYRQAAERIPYRVRSLRALVRHLGPKRELFLLTRSASGRIASLAADEPGIARIACLGYPFQHPQEGPNPDRTAHLAHLRTPFLILQGTRDAYGGYDDLGNYPLSETITVEWLDTDHDFDLPAPQWDALLTRVQEFFFDSKV